MVKAGLKPSDAAIIGVGATASAVAAMQRGEIEIISNAEPVISKMEQDGLIVPLVDTRTEEGTRKIFGGSNPAATLYSTGAYIEKNPETMQRLTNAFLKSLKWLRTAKPEEVADAVPAEYHLGDKDLYTRAVKNSLESYSRDGVVAQAGMTSVMDMLRTLDPEMQGRAGRSVEDLHGPLREGLAGEDAVSRTHRSKAKRARHRRTLLAFRPGPQRAAS
jgi:NitT/TauT family transport system substrate-binding protein